MNINFAGNFKPVANFVFPTYTIFHWILIAVLAVSFLMQLYYTLRYWLKAARPQDSESAFLESYISVILPTRNTEEQIAGLIDQLMQQDYGNFEIVAVNEYSEDRTAEVLKTIAQHNPKLVVTGIEEQIRFAEKMVINLGMKASHAEWVIFVTPDEKQMDPRWLAMLNSNAEDDVDAVVAYSNLLPQKGFKQKFFRIEKFIQYFQSVSFILSGKTLIATQDNVLIRKNIYFEKGGFRTHINKYFANLEFILNEKLNSKRIRIAPGQAAIKTDDSELARTAFKDLILKSMQIRKNLPFLHKFVMRMDNLSRWILFITTILIGAFTIPYWYVFIAPLFISTLLMAIIVRKSQKLLNERKMFLSSFAYIMLRPVILFIVSLSMLSKARRRRWN